MQRVDFARGPRLDAGRLVNGVGAEGGLEDAMFSGNTQREAAAWVDRETKKWDAAKRPHASIALNVCSSCELKVKISRTRSVLRRPALLWRSAKRELNELRTKIRLRRQRYFVFAREGPREPANPRGREGQQSQKIAGNLIF